MSGNHHRPDRNEPEDELESLLKRLQPTPLDFDQMNGLSREYERVATVKANSPTHVQWKRLIPLVSACGLIMCAIALYQIGFKFTRGIPEDQNPPTLASPAVLVTEIPAEQARPAVPALPIDSLTSDTLSDRFVPVSSRGYLLNTSSHGVVETAYGPRERLQLEYEDSYHWHDPNTGTNIRIYTPRSEEMIVPLISN